MTRRAAHILLLLAAALALSACAALTRLAYSNVTLAYSNLVPMASWMVDDYVELSGVQKDWVRERFNRVMQWHRTQELPEYRRFLQRVLQESEEPFTVAEIASAYADLRVHYHRTIEQLIPDVADFFLQLDAEQVAHLERKFADDNRKFVRESVKGTPEERRERRVKRLVQHLEGWVGPLSEEQEALVDARHHAVSDLIDERLADRRFRQMEILNLIRSRPGKERMMAGLRRLLIDTESWRRPEYQEKLKEREMRMFEMFSALSTTLTREQRSHLQERIRRYMRDISTLNAAG